MSLPLYTLSLFLPSIIRDLGYTAAQAQLLTIPPYAVAFVKTMALAVLAERLAVRAPIIMASSSFAIIGYIVSKTPLHTSISLHHPSLPCAPLPSPSQQS